MSVPPEGDHLVDLQGPRGVGPASSCPQRAVLHLGQEVLRKRTSHVIVVPILEHKTDTALNACPSLQRRRCN